jgi:hypothetical protein
MRIDDNYKIDFDNVGATLIYEELRTRKKDGDDINYTYTDKWYFLNIQQCLNKYLDLSMGDATDVKECIKKINEVRNFINKFVSLHQ